MLRLKKFNGGGGGGGLFDYSVTPGPVFWEYDSRLPDICQY